MVESKIKDSEATPRTGGIQEIDLTTEKIPTPKASSLNVDQLHTPKSSMKIKTKASLLGEYYCGRELTTYV